MCTYAKEEEGGGGEGGGGQEEEEERTHTHVKDPVVHVRVRWIRESPI